MNALKVTAEARLKEAQGEQQSSGAGSKKSYTTWELPTNLARHLSNKPKIA